MSNSGNDPSENSEINLPPIQLPDPDPFDTSQTEGKKGRKKGKKPKKKGRHPLDKPKDVRREKRGSGCCGGLGCLFLIALLILGAIGAGGYFLFGEFKEGYAIVQLESTNETISEAPTEPTLYIGQGNVTYNAPRTSVPIGIFGQTVEVSGDFTENLSLRGVKVICKGGARCLKNLNIYAFEFVDEGVEVRGAKQGKTYK